MVLGAAGFEPLAGCSCGCGIECGGVGSVGLPYARWVCSNNVGYSCTGQVESSLLFTAEPDPVPCTVQNDAVVWWINIFFLLIPGICGLIAAYYAKRQLITGEVHETIRKGLLPDATQRIDPFTNSEIRIPQNTPGSLLLEHYAADEVAMLSKPDGLTALKKWVQTRLGGFVGVLMTLIAVMAATGGLEDLVTLGCLACMFLMVLIPWDAYRASAADGPPVPAPIEATVLLRAARSVPRVCGRAAAHLHQAGGAPRGYPGGGERQRHHNHRPRIRLDRPAHARGGGGLRPTLTSM